MKTKKPTIWEIKNSITNEPKYFDRKTLKFFGKKVSDFKVYRTEKENEFLISAPQKHGGFSERIYNAETKKLQFVERV